MAFTNPLEELTPKEFQDKVLPILQNVFNFPGSMLKIFPDRFLFRMIDDNTGLKPIDSLVNVLKTVSLKEEGSGFYYVIMDIDGPNLDLGIPPKFSKSWFVHWDNVEYISHIVSPLCYAWISPMGNWGLFSTYENFLLLGATEEFGNILLNLEPNIVEGSLVRFFGIYKIMSEKFGYKWVWIPNLLEHLFGQQKGILSDGLKLFHVIENP